MGSASGVAGEGQLSPVPTPCPLLLPPAAPTQNDMFLKCPLHLTVFK